MRRTTVTLLVLLPLLAATPVRAQQQTARFDDAATATLAQEDVRPALRAMRVAKWSTLVASLAAAGYGLMVHHDANDTFTRLETICEDEPGRCSERADDGSYADPELEDMYQRVLQRDERARAGLIASQIGLASSVVLFILDLRESDTPPNIIYDPDRFRIVPGRGGGAELRWRVPAGSR